MKTVLLSLWLALAAALPAADSVATSPRIVALTGAPHPQALIQSVSAREGVVLFAWLDAAGKPVDSGGSVARFTPLAPLPPAPDAAENAAPIYPDVPDATLAAAIANPPALVVPVPESVTRRQLLVALFMATGVKDTDILTSLAAIADPAARYVATVEFREAGEFRRAHPLIAQLAGQLSLSAEQVDEIFRAAAKL